MVETNIYNVVMKDKYLHLIDNFKVNPKSCDNPEHYEDYLKYNAILDCKKGLGTTYLFIEEIIENGSVIKENIVSYITLKASSLILEDGSFQSIGYPALEISELAVAEQYEHKGIGTLMMGFTISLACELNEKFLGIQYLLLCADKAAVGFYKKLGLKEQNNCYRIPRETWNVNCVPMGLKIKHN